MDETADYLIDICDAHHADAENSGNADGCPYCVIQQLRTEVSRYKEAYDVARGATLQSHTGHWDRTGGHGSGCPECQRARDARTRCDEILARVSGREKPENEDFETINRLKTAIGNAICVLDDIPGASGTVEDLENALANRLTGVVDDSVTPPEIIAQESEVHQFHVCPDCGLSVVDADLHELKCKGRDVWLCPMCGEPSGANGLVTEHKESCCHFGSALAPPAEACVDGSHEQPVSLCKEHGWYAPGPCAYCVADNEKL